MEKRERKINKLSRLPKSEVDYVWVAPNTELGKEGDFIPGTGVRVDRGKLYSERVGFVNIDRNNVIRVVPLAGG